MNMTKTDTDFRIWDTINRTDSRYITLTKTTFIEQNQEIPSEEHE